MPMRADIRSAGASWQSAVSAPQAGCPAVAAVESRSWRGTSPRYDRLDVPTSPALSETSPHSGARERVLFFCEQFLGGIQFQSTFGEKPLQASIFLFQLAQPLRFRNAESAEFLSPAIEGVFCDTMFTTNRPNRLPTAFGLLQDTNDLLLGKLALFHPEPPRSAEILTHEPFLSVGSMSEGVTWSSAYARRCGNPSTSATQMCPQRPHVLTIFCIDFLRVGMPTLTSRSRAENTCLRRTFSRSRSFNRAASRASLPLHLFIVLLCLVSHKQWSEDRHQVIDQSTTWILKIGRS